MPIRRALRKYYGRQHRAYRAALIAKHGATCRVCERTLAKYINLCHLERDPAASGVVELRCPSCHAKYDARWNRALARRTIAKGQGQAWLWPEVEYAPVALSEISAGVLAKLRKALQGRLFT